MDLDKIKLDIVALFEECLSSAEPFHKKIDLFVVPAKLAERVLLTTSIDISNHWVCIDNYGIIHTLMQHGNPISELKRGQIAIEKEDFLAIIQVLLEPDEILFVGNTKRTNLPLLQFEKTINNKKIVVKEVRTIQSKSKK